MLISLITNDEYHSMRLPERTQGRFVFRDPHSGMAMFTLTGNPRGWTVTPAQYGRLTNMESADMVSGMLLHVRIREDWRPALLYLEDTGHYYAKYARCMVPDNAEYTVGSGSGCDFVCRNIQITSLHFRLICRNRVWTVKDCGSALGTFVNGRRIPAAGQKLKPGDVVSALNQKFILLPGLMVFNAQNIDPDSLKHKVTLLKVPPLPLNKPLSREIPRQFFRRKPRYMQDAYNREGFDIMAPPSPQGPDQSAPAILMMGPTIVSGLAMLVGGMANPIAGIGMLASALVFPQINRKRGEKLRKVEEEKRKKIYTDYLEKLGREMDKLLAEQTELLRKRNPDPRIESEKLLADDSEMWCRRPEHGDFLDIRLGVGKLPALAKISFPKDNPLSEDDDPMREKLEKFQEKPRELRDVPIMLPLKQFYSVGITGPDELTVPFTAFMLMQLAMHIGPDDMKLCMIGSLPGDLEPLRWLPHTWDINSDMHLTASCKDDLDRLIPALDQILSGYLDKKDEDAVDLQELIILITDPSAAHTGALTRLLFDQTYPHVHVFILSKHGADLPSRTAMAIALREKNGRMLWQDGLSRNILDFVPDKPFSLQIDPLAKLMANTYLEMQKDSIKMPSSLSFLEMFGVSDVNDLNVLNRWDNADPIKNLSVPIGISEDGDLCTLDIHEKADGPHGLIAGTTGSGKSELIMCYILSLAVCYSPEDVAFVLIDYKGGGMAQAFEHLPHTAGIITNLDGNELNRSLQSINSELQRRQRIFSDTKRDFGNMNIDIYKYQRLYRERKVTEPVPHLIIITDEFAELKTQQPEFMQELIRAARIGRSLGVHLILATQKPSGVVNDQIWSNTNFRLCLRVQDAGDSREVIKAPDAAMLTNPGSFYKQVGYGITMTKAQSGYTGADYDPGGDSVPNCGIDVLDPLGSVIRHQALPRTGKKNSAAQLQVVTDLITEIAKRENYGSRLLWQPTLEPVISPQALYRKYSISVDPWMPDAVLGEADDPANQRRLPVRVPVCSGKNAIIYGALGSGKLMSLKTILEDLLLHHNAEQLNLYLLDYADDGLGVYNDSPQVGDVLFSDDDEKLLRLLNYLEDTIKIRKKILGGASASIPLPQRLKKEGLPNILVVMHQLSGILYRLESQMDRLIRLLKDGPRWGITFLATQDTASGVRFQVAQRFPLLYVLQMDRPDDYMVLLGRTGGMKPSAVKGRGLVRVDDVLYEFQTASADRDPALLCGEIKKNWPGRTAPMIRVMPETVNAAILQTYYDIKRPLCVPVGLNTETIEPMIYPFDSRTLHLIIGSRTDTELLLTGIIQTMHRAGMSITILDEMFDAEGTVPDAGQKETAGVVREMFEECKRMKTENTPEQISARKQRVFVIPAVQDVLRNLSDDDAELLRAMLEISRADWKWTFLVCDTAQNLERLRRSASDRVWMTDSAPTDEGIFLGSGINSQSVLRINGDSMAMRQVSGFPLGFVVRGGRAEKVRFIS